MEWWNTCCAVIPRPERMAFFGLNPPASQVAVCVPWSLCRVPPLACLTAFLHCCWSPARGAAVFHSTPLGRPPGGGGRAVGLCRDNQASGGPRRPPRRGCRLRGPPPPLTPLSPVLVCQPPLAGSAPEERSAIGTARFRAHTSPSDAGRECQVNGRDLQSLPPSEFVWPVARAAPPNGRLRCGLWGPVRGSSGPGPLPRCLILSSCCCEAGGPTHSPVNNQPQRCCRPHTVRVGVWLVCGGVRPTHKGASPLCWVTCARWSWSVAIGQ